MTGCRNTLKRYKNLKIRTITSILIFTIIIMLSHVSDAYAATFNSPEVCATGDDSIIKGNNFADGQYERGQIISPCTCSAGYVEEPAIPAEPKEFTSSHVGKGGVIVTRTWTEYIPYQAPQLIDKYPGFMNRIVACAKEVIEGAVKLHLVEIHEKTTAVISVILILYLMFFGVRVTLGALENTRGEIMVVVFTTLIISYLLINFHLGEYITLFTDTQEALANTVSEPIAGDLCGYDSVWERVDCTIAYLMGASYDPDSDVLTRFYSAEGIREFVPFALAFTLISTDPTMGIVLLVLNIVSMILIILAFGQAVLIYLMSLIAVSFLGLLGPIIIPLVLFKQTKEIFTLWLQILISFVLLPAIVLAYISFMVNVMAFVIQGDDDAKSDILQHDGTGNYVARDIFTPIRLDLDPDYDCDEDKAGQQIYCENVEETGGVPGLASLNNTFKDADIVYLPVVELCNAVLGCDKTITAEERMSGVSSETDYSALTFPQLTGFNDDCESILPKNATKKQKDDCEKSETNFIGFYLHNLMALVMVMFLTLSFMVNVIEFGAQLAGMASTHVAKVANMVNASISKGTQTVSDLSKGGHPAMMVARKAADKLKDKAGGKKKGKDGDGGGGG